MPRPSPRRMDDEQDETTQQAAPVREARGAVPLKGGLWFLAACTLAVGSCSGLATGCEAIGHGSGMKVTQNVQTGDAKASYIVPTDSTTATVGVAFRLLYALACLAAVALAAAAFGQAACRSALAHLAAGLGVVRIVIAGIDYVLVEEAMELMRAVARRQSGYSYGQVGEALNQAEDLGTSFMVWLGVALAIYWAITSVVFWPTKEEAGSAVDRMA